MVCQNGNPLYSVRFVSFDPSDPFKTIHRHSFTDSRAQAHSHRSLGLLSFSSWVPVPIDQHNNRFSPELACTAVRTLDLDPKKKQKKALNGLTTTTDNLAQPALLDP